MIAASQRRRRWLSPGYPVAAFAARVATLAAVTSTEDGEPLHWFMASWNFAKQILPLLLAGVLVEVPVMLSVCGVCNRTRHWFGFGQKISRSTA